VSGSTYATEAAELIAELDVIAEDDARPGRPPVGGPDAAIDHLRDARERQAMQPGGASVLDGDSPVAPWCLGGPVRSR
jgi:hypothetical protein